MFLEDEEYEKEFRESLQQTLKAFDDYLTKQGLKDQTINAHVGRIHFFAETYLNYNGSLIKEFHSQDIIDFLGDYYIRKVLNSGEKDINPYLTAFKKFAAFLHATEKLSEAELKEINWICKQKDYFMYRFETYYSSHDIEAWHFDNNLYQYVEDMEQAYQLSEDDTLEIDMNFVELLNQKNIATPIAVRAFLAFLEKIQTEATIKLTSTRQHINRKFWLALDQSLDLDLFYKPTLNQEDIGLFHFFYLAGKQLKVFRITGNKLEPTALLDVYLKLTDNEKFYLLIDVLWNQLSWGDVQPSKTGGRVEVTQAKRSKVANALSLFPINEEIKLREDKEGLKLTNLMFMGAYTDPFLKYIMPILEYFELFELGLWFNEDVVDPYYVGIDSIKMNPSGLFISNQLKKMGNEQPENAQTDSMTDFFINMGLHAEPIVKDNKVGRNDPCPCGSGKKYKRCCM